MIQEHAAGSGGFVNEQRLPGRLGHTKQGRPIELGCRAAMNAAKQPCDFPDRCRDVDGPVDDIVDFWEIDNRLAGVHCSLNGCRVVGNSITNRAEVSDAGPFRQVLLGKNNGPIPHGKMRQLLRRVLGQADRIRGDIVLDACPAEDLFSMFRHRGLISGQGDVSGQQVAASFNT